MGSTTYDLQLDENYPIENDTNEINHFFIRELDARYRTFNDRDRSERSSESRSHAIPVEEIILFKQLLAKHPDGIPTLQLSTLYKQHCGRELTVDSWGYRNISHLIFANSTLFSIQNFDDHTAKKFPDYPTDYIIHDAATFRAPVVFSDKLKVDIFRLVLEFNNRGERFPVRHLVEYYRYYYDDPDFDLRFTLLKALFETMLAEFPIVIDGNLDQLYTNDINDLGTGPDGQQNTSRLLDLSSDLSEMAQPPNCGMKAIDSAQPLPAIQMPVDMVEMDTQELTVESSVSNNQGCPPITFKYKDSAELSVIYQDKNLMINRSERPLCGLKSRRSLFMWKERCVQSGKGGYLVNLCNRKDLPANVCMPGDTFEEFRLPYDHQSSLGSGNHLIRASIAAVASPKTVFLQETGTSRQEFNRLSLDMNHFYNTLPNDGFQYRVPEWFIYKSYPCVSCINPDVADPYKREWERCKVVGIDKDDVIVESVDYAGQRLVEFSKLRLLTLKFARLPVQLMQVKMMAMEPLDDNSVTWKKAQVRIGNFSLSDYELDCALFKRLSVDKGKNRSSNRYEVIIFDRNDPDLDICINDVIVIEGYAKIDPEMKSKYQERREIIKSILAKQDRPNFLHGKKMVVFSS